MFTIFTASTQPDLLIHAFYNPCLVYLLHDIKTIVQCEGQVMRGEPQYARHLALCCMHAHRFDSISGSDFCAKETLELSLRVVDTESSDSNCIF